MNGPRLFASTVRASRPTYEGDGILGLQMTEIKKNQRLSTNSKDQAGIL